MQDNGRAPAKALCLDNGRACNSTFAMKSEITASMKFTLFTTTSNLKHFASLKKE